MGERIAAKSYIDNPALEDYVPINRAAGTTKGLGDPTHVLGLSQLRAMFGAPVNPMNRKIGAAGTGTSDDTGALNLAFAKILANGGGALYLPPGKTFAASGLVLPNVPFLAYGGGTLKLKNGAAEHAHLVTLASGQVGAQFDGIKLDLNRANQSYSLAGIVAPNAQRLRVRGCHFQNGNGPGVYLLDGDDIEIAANKFTGFDGTNLSCVLGYAINGAHLNDVRVMFNLFDRSTTTDTDPRNCWLGWSVSGTGKVVNPFYFRNRSLLPRTIAGIGLEAWGGDGDHMILGALAIGNYCEGGGMGISFDHCDQGDMTHNRTLACLLALEYAGGTRGDVSRNRLDGDYRKDSSGISIDNQNIGGVANLANDNTIVRMMAWPIKFYGSASYTVARAKCRGNDIESAAVTGTATAGASSTITLQNNLPAGMDPTNLWIKTTGGTGSGQQKIITGYVSGTRVATVHSTWDVTPDNTTTYAIFNPRPFVEMDRVRDGMVESNTLTGTGYEPVGISNVNGNDFSADRNVVRNLLPSGDAIITTADGVEVSNNKFRHNRFTTGLGINGWNTVSGGSIVNTELEGNEGYVPFGVKRAHMIVDRAVSAAAVYRFESGFAAGSPEGVVEGTPGSQVTNGTTGALCTKPPGGGNGNTGWHTVDTSAIP